MSELPIMPFYVGDYLADTAHLDAEEHGVYLLLLFHYWKRRQAPKSDPKTLRKITKIGAKRWRTVAPVVLEFFEERDGKLYHSRMEKELQIAAEKRQRRVAAGRAGGLAKAQQSSSNAKAMGVANGKQSDSDSNNNTPLPPQVGELEDGKPDKPDRQGRRVEGTNPRARGESPRQVAQRELEEKRKRARISEQVQRDVDNAWAEIHAVPYHEWKQQQEEKNRSPDDEIVL